MVVVLAALRMAAVALAGVRGTVRAAGPGAPIAGVHVQLDGVERAITDSIGRYALSGLTPGSHEFRFVSSGFESQRIVVTLADGSSLNLDVELSARPLVLPAIEAVAQRAGETAGVAARSEPGATRFGPGWQFDRPASGADLQQLIATVPGVASRGDNVSALSIRGGRGSENRLLLDGIPLSGASHFAGAASGVNPDAIASVDVHTGVSSARFDGALSGVVEVHTGDVTPPGVRIAASASASDVRSLVQLPVGRGSLLIGGRTSFRDLLTDGSGLGVSNGYQDFIAVGRVPIGRGTLRIVSFESGNRMRWAPSADGRDGGSDDVVASPQAAAMANAANWRSAAAGATWTQPLGAGSEWHLASWWSGSSAAIRAAGASATQDLSSGIGELGLSTELRQRRGAGTLLIGAEMTRPNSWYRVDTTPMASGDSTAYAAMTARPLLAAAYGEWSWHASRWLDLRLGVRGNSDFVHRTSLAPRMVLSLHPDPVTRIDAGFGRTHQTVQSMLNEENLTSTIISPALPAATTAGTPIARADQYELSLSRELGRGTTVTLDGYARVWHDVLSPAATTTGYFATRTPDVGDGRASGVLASIVTARGPFAFHATAGLASATQRFAGGSYHVGFEQPWSLSGDLRYRPGTRTTVQLQWATAAGQPATAMLPGLEWRPYSGATGSGEIEGVANNLPGAVNGLRLPGRLRVDLGLRHLWSLGGSRAGGISTSVRLENLFNRSDPAGVVSGADGSLQLLRGTPRGVVFELGWVY